MKKILLASSALVAFAASAHAADLGRRPAPVAVAPAACALTGVGNFYAVFANGDEDYYGYSGNGFGFGGSAKANLCLGNQLGLQLDAFGETTQTDEDSDWGGYGASQFGGVAHLYLRDPNSYAVGVLAGVSKLTESDSDYNSGVLGTFGVDAHLYLGNFTLAGQAVYFKSFGYDPDGSATIDHGYDVSLEGRYFVTPNLKLAATVGYTHNTDDYGPYPYKAIYYGVSGEYKFGSSPVSVFASLTRFDGKLDGYNYDNTTGKVGLSIKFGQPTLISEDRTGASFKTPGIDTFSHSINAYYR